MDNIAGIIAGVEAGLGSAVVPLHLVKGLMNIKIVLHARELRQPAYLYHLKQPFYSKLHTAIVKELAAKIRDYIAL